MLCSFLRRVVKVGHPQFIRSESYKIFRFKAFASFYSGSLFLWACCCCSYSGGNLSSFGGDISKTSECKKEENRLFRRDHPARTKVQKLEAPSSPLVQRPERSSSPLAEAPLVLCSLPSSEPIAEVGNPLGEGDNQPLAALLITV